MNFEKSRFILSTSTSTQTNLAVSGNAEGGTSPYNGLRLISTWNVSLRKLIRNTYDQYTRIYLEVYLVTTSYTSFVAGVNNTWDQSHILKLSGLNFINQDENFVYVAPFRTTQGIFTIVPVLGKNGFIVDISEDIKSISSTLLNVDLKPNCSVNGWPHYNIFFNAYGIPGYERVSKEPNKNNY